MQFHRFSREFLAATPWKNGGGVTREIVCHVPDAGTATFDWRVSIAHIAANGPFSLFPGVDRVITLLEGSGVRLRSSSDPSSRAVRIDHLLNSPLEPFSFPGDVPVEAELLGSDCHDFNVMTRRSSCYAQVHVCRGAASLDAAPGGVLMATAGHWRVNSEDLNVGQGLWWADMMSSWSVSCADEKSSLLAVLIFPVSS